MSSDQRESAFLCQDRCLPGVRSMGLGGILARLYPNPTLFEPTCIQRLERVGRLDPL